MRLRREIRDYYKVTFRCIYSLKIEFVIFEIEDKSK